MYATYMQYNKLLLLLTTTTTMMMMLHRLLVHTRYIHYHHYAHVVVDRQLMLTATPCSLRAQ